MKTILCFLLGHKTQLLTHHHFPRGTTDPHLYTICYRCANCIKVIKVA